MFLGKFTNVFHKTKKEVALFVKTTSYYSKIKRTRKNKKNIFIKSNSK